MSVTSSDPRSRETVVNVAESTPEHLASLLSGAQDAVASLAATNPAARRDWLHAVADALDSPRAELAALADRETALGLPRLEGEVARASAQLRFYGDVAVEGSLPDLDEQPQWSVRSRRSIATASRTKCSST